MLVSLTRPHTTTTTTTSCCCGQREQGREAARPQHAREEATPALTPPVSERGVERRRADERPASRRGVFVIADGPTAGLSLRLPEDTERG